MNLSQNQAGIALHTDTFSCCSTSLPLPLPSFPQLVFWLLLLLLLLLQEDEEQSAGQQSWRFSVASYNILADKYVSHIPQQLLMLSTYWQYQQLLGTHIGYLVMHMVAAVIECDSQLTAMKLGFNLGQFLLGCQCCLCLLLCLGRHFCSYLYHIFCCCCCSAPPPSPLPPPAHKHIHPKKGSPLPQLPVS
jgi:hypothetical protein